MPKLLLPLLAAAASLTVPATRREPVTDVYHGVKVTEEYRWLEDGASPEVKAWMEAQNRLSRDTLDALPARGPLREYFTKMYAQSSSSFSSLQYRGQKLFAIKVQPPLEQPLLVRLDSADEPLGEKVVLDPNTMKGGLAIDWYVPARDGVLVAVALSEGGSEDASLHFFDSATGQKLPDMVPRVNYPTAGGSACWDESGTGVFYTRLPQGSERPKEDLNFYQQVYHHKLGTPSSADTYVIGREFPRIAEIQLLSSADGRHLLASVANGDGGEFAHWLKTPDGRWTQLSRFEDKVVSATVGPDHALYLLSRQGAPRGKVLRLPFAKPSLSSAKVVVPQAEASIERPLVVSQTRLFVPRVAGGPSQVDVYDQAGKPLGKLPLPEVAAMREMVALEGDTVLFRAETYVEPSAWYRYDASGKAARTALFTKAPVSFEDGEVVRELASSKDGTLVPVNIVRRKGTRLDGSNPALLVGYGGFGISLSPFFLGSYGRLWLDRGGVFVVANLRGGGEFGEEWHRAGNLTRKQAVFDDFAACARHLIDRRYTSPDKLAIERGSNGGLLMGAALTQHPELFRAVVAHVGVYDMLRVERDPNGEFNTTEFGTVKNREQFRALYAYSPYHRVKDGVAYPAVFMLTGENDGRVNPAHSRKMTARLQAATSSGRPVLLRTSMSSGHGFGTAASEEIEQAADVFAFLFDQLGVRYP